jgi:DNA-binding GntR family transcriptional regulator
MASFEEHSQRCRELLGRGYPEVHQWLDEFFGQPPYGTRHRHLRHHRQGIEEVRKLWGDEAAKAAEVHIRQDLEQEGWPAERPLPNGPDDYMKAGLW